jgi:hypothetical protein
MHKLFIVLALFCIYTTSLHAQKSAMGSTYKSAIGLKYYPGSITAKTFIQPDRGVEGLISFWDYGTRFIGLYEFYGDVNGIEGLKWYVGPGAHIGFWNDKWNEKYPEREGGFMFGIDGVIGIDYKINKAPINVSLDWQPSLNFVGYNYFEGGWGGVAIRYAF